MIFRLQMILVAVAALTVACAQDDLMQAPVEAGGDNPFLFEEPVGGKGDTGYVNPDGIEVEVTIEADVTASSYRIFDAPADLGQFAVTDLRNRRILYIESLAEDASSDERVEWLVDGEWITATAARQVDHEKLTHFRIQAVDAVLLYNAADGVGEGQVYRSTVPVAPYTAHQAGESCINPDDHLGTGASIYWYLWNPHKSSCELETQEMQVTVSSVLPSRNTTYPEYDQLVADGTISSVVLFGQIGDDLDDNDPGVRNMNRMVRFLTNADFEEVDDAPVGRRFSRTVSGVNLVVDLYSPYDFSGLSDMAHLSNFNRAIEEHEIIAYDGHSMLGASDFWTRPDYPDFYQIFLYGGCLGYQYYVKPILEGKDGWANLDVMSSVFEVSADANYYFGPFLGRLIWALENDYKASWSDMLTDIRRRVGDSSFGVSGVADNCFSPTGSLCGGGGEPTTTNSFENTGELAIPDNDDSGVSSVIVVPEGVVAAGVQLELDITHTWVGDLLITLSHGDTEVVVWNKSGGSNKDIDQTFTLAEFAGLDSAGDWTLHITDTANRDVGTLNRWAVVLAE